MILGIGNDIIEIERIQANIEKYKHRFLNRIFTKKEQLYCLNKKNPAIHFAGRFAAKEAIVKALGTGFRQGITWVDIEILNDGNGKPLVSLSPKLVHLFSSPSILLSISHCRHYATAFAIWSTP
jgi:holo-[acyl-carrier protein] synthase